MQYIDYPYAKKNNCIGLVIYLWMKITPNLSLEARGHTIKNWREDKCLLNIGDKSPGFANQEILNEWTKQQIDPRFHRESYQKAYLKGYFKI